MIKEDKEKETPKTDKKKNYIKKILKCFFYVVIGFIALNLLLYGLLSIPYIQKKTLDFALNIIKEKVQTEVRIDGIRLSLFNNVHLEGIYLEDQKQDTLVYAQELSVGLSPFRLLKNELLIKSIKLNNFTANISQETPDSDFNFQFLIDAFAGDTTVTDTTQSSLRISIKDISLKNGNLRYDILSEVRTPEEFNPSHIHISELDGNIQLPSLDMMNLKASISSLSFLEASGLKLENLKATVTSDKLTYYLKDGEIALPHSQLKIPSAQYNLLTKAFSLETEKSVISPTDLLPIMADLKYLRNNIELQASIKGKLPLISVDSLFLDYGSEASIRAGMSISDYANYDKADLALHISRFRITPEAINDFAKIGDPTFVMPDILKNLGIIRLEASAKGQLHNISLQAEAWAKQGALQLMAKAAVDTTFENYSANAQLHTQNFSLGDLLEIPELGGLSADMNVIASQTTAQPLKADVTGKIENIHYNKQDFTNIPFTAYYNAEQMGAWLNAVLPQGKLEAKVDMTQSDNPRIDVDIDAQNIQIDKFYSFPEWRDPELTLHIKGNITGLDLKDIKADMVVENLKFSHDSISFQPGTITFQAGVSDSLQNYIHLQSSLIDASIEGKYDFMTVSDELTNIMNAYLPSMFPQTKIRQKQNNNNFDFSLSVNNTEEFTRVFNLPVDIIDPLTMRGNINTINNNLKITAQAPTIRYGEYSIKNTLIDISNTDSLIALTGNSRFIMDAYDISLGLNSTIQSDSIYAILNAKRDSTDLDININLDATAHFETDNTGNLISYLKFKPTFWDIGKLNLSFMPAEISNTTDRTTIHNFGFMVGQGRVLNKYLGMDGTISPQPQDTLNVSFFHANLGYLLQAFDVENISTIANGDIQFTKLMDNPEVYTDNMRFSDIIIFNDTLGTLNIKSQWNNAIGAANLDASLINGDITSTISGQVDMKESSLDLQAKIDRLSLAWLQPFMTGMLNHISGSISTQLAIKGKIDAPEVRGWLGVNDAYIGIDYTNVTYHISDTIDITPEKIGFDNLIVEDPSKNRARVNALVTHQNFKNLQYSLNANLNNFMVLNTQSRTDSLFYGKVFANGTVNIKGSDDGIDMTMNIRNARNSVLNVQVPQTAEAAEYPSIVFINTPSDGNIIDTKKEEEPPAVLPLKLKANLNVSPDFLLGVTINPLTGDRMEAKGTGLIDFTYDMESETMNAFGQYTLSDGFVKMKLQNIATVEFRIQEGSKLIFNGDPMRTSFDITAYKRVRADLRTLDQSFGTDQYNSPIVMANAVLGIKGDMKKMQLTYDVSLPDASDDVQQRVRSILVTDDEKIRQFASLVVTGSFYSGGSSVPTGNLAHNMLTSVASSALSSGLNAALGNVIGSDWQIGTNFQTDDGSFSNMDMSVSLSRSFLDNRLEFNTNLGYRTDQANDDSFIGDFDVMYALTRSIKLKVFNKTNDRYYRQAPTTQGVGIIYTREAKTIKQLFRFFRKGRPRPANNQAQTTNSR